MAGVCRLGRRRRTSMKSSSEELEASTLVVVCGLQVRLSGGEQSESDGLWFTVSGGAGVGVNTGGELSSGSPGMRSSPDGKSCLEGVKESSDELEGELWPSWDTFRFKLTLSVGEIG